MHLVVTYFAFAFIFFMFSTILTLAPPSMQDNEGPRWFAKKTMAAILWPLYVGKFLWQMSKWALRGLKFFVINAKEIFKDILEDLRK